MGSGVAVSNAADESMGDFLAEASGWFAGDFAAPAHQQNAGVWRRVKRERHRLG